ncbi:MAG: phasin family protein [Acidocella sp.]|nr:phasin family protein [Acidocella sp.]
MSTTKSKAATAAVVDSTAETVNETAAAAAKGFDKTLTAMKEGMEKASKGFESQQVKMKESVEKAMKTAEEMVAFSQGNVEAFVKASQIFTAGLQDLSKHLTAQSKAAFEESTNFTKTLMGVKSVKEAVDLQSGFAKASLEKAVAETSKITDASVKLAEQAVAPLTARLTLAVEKFGKTH